VNELSLHFLAKKKILVVRDVERTDIPFICKTLNCTPIAHIDGLSKEKLGHADLVEHEMQSDGNRVLKVTGIKNMGKTVSMLIRGSNNLVNSINFNVYFLRLLMRQTDHFMMPFVLLDA